MYVSILSNSSFGFIGICIGYCLFTPVGPLGSNYLIYEPASKYISIIYQYTSLISVVYGELDYLNKVITAEHSHWGEYDQ
jgi:hypothetical protein